MGLLTGDNKSHDYIIIVGCSHLGAILACSLSNSGSNVLIIDNDKEAFRKLSSSFGGDTLAGDATDIDVLQKANIEKATAVVSVTNNDNTNIMVTQIAKELFKIKYVIARLYDPERECVYSEFGIDTICPAVLSEKEIRKLLFNSKKEGECE